MTVGGGGRGGDFLFFLAGGWWLVEVGRAALVVFLYFSGLFSVRTKI